MIRAAAALLLAPALLVAACQPAGTNTAEGPVLSYTDAFIMEPLGGRDITSGGITITVEGGDVRLTGASADIAETVETHTMSMQGDRMTMAPVDGWDIEDGGTLTLERGGDHLMLFGVREGLSAGDAANITLTFETPAGETLTLEAEAEVRALGK